MRTGRSYRKDVEFLESRSAPLVERNADELKRLHDLLVAVDPSAERAEKHTRWKSEGSRPYEERLAESRKLLAGLADGYEKAAGALRAYSYALQTAKTHYTNGTVSEQALADLIGTKGVAISGEAQQAAARSSGLPPDTVAGIAWKEVAGQPGIMDDLTDTLREQAESPLSPIAPESLPWRLRGESDNTSMGPIAIQIRRGAEVLGYDPDHLSDQQRGIIEDSLQDPAQNIFVASEYLAQPKAESDFADVPAEEMTPEQYQEPASRYHGGPYWQSPQAQNHGRDFTDNLDHARNALR
ncbi:hypothetical protein ACIQNG_07055 [Streptomyces sp. NPDC091377]|uniref:hypothetical protein n=1 Tax=Streptomyces sp. NPDC091377 TaxID=3365995 RepID=UPI0038257AA3